jgi:gliding motility-associated-like protein
MKKLYLFIFLIVISVGLTIQPANAHSNKLLTGRKVSAKAATYVITFTAPGSKALTNVDFTPVATSTSSLPIPITFTSDNPAVATIVNGNIHFIAVGTAHITASQGGGTTGTATLPADVTQTLTVTVPTLTLTAPGSKPYGTADFALVTTQSLTNIPVTFTSSNTAVATITNGTVHLTGALGTSTITASQGGGSTGVPNLIPADVTSVLTVTGPALTFAALGTKQFTPADLAPGATSTVATPAITYTSSNPAVATIVNGNIHYIGAPAAPNNTTVITASQGGGSSGTALLPADIAQVLTVTPVTISFPTLGTKTYTTQDFNPGVSTNVGTTATVPYRLVYLTSSNPAVATITNTQAYALTSGGTLYTNGTYTNVPLIGGTGTGMVATIVVASGSVTTASVITTVGTNYTNLDVLTVPASSIGGTGSGLVITLGAYTGVIHYNNNVPAAPNNTTIITASMGGGPSGTLTLAADASQVLTLNAPGITFPPLGTKQFTSADFNPGASGALIGLPVTYTSSNPAVATIVNGLIHFTGAPAAPNNTTVITASQIPSAGINTGTLTLPASVSQTLTVTPPTITFAAIGTKTIGPDFNPGAISTITNIPVSYTSSNTAVATVTANGISSISNSKPGVFYVPGNYINVPLTGGTGSGAQASISVVTTGQAFITAVTSSGTGYQVGDILSCAPASLGGPATAGGFSITVASVSNMIHFTGAPAAPNNTTVITATQGGGATGTLTLPPDVSQTLTVTAPVITFPALGTKPFTDVDLNPAATSTLSTTPITYTSSNTAVATIDNNSIMSLLLPTGGTLYKDGTYTNVPLTGGTGTGAVATITALGGAVTTVTITSNNSGYTAGDILTCLPLNVGGTGAGFNVTVGSVSSLIHFTGSPAAPNNTTVITASQGGGATGTLALPANVSQTLTVTPGVISFSTLGTKTYPSLDFSPTVTSTVTAKPITFTSSNPAVATIINGIIHLASAPAAPNNTTVITASQGGGATGTTTLPPDATQTLTVTSALAVFTFPPLGTKVLTNVDINPGASSPLVGVPITYTSSNPAVATIVNGNIHLVGAPAAPNNTTTITVSQGGGTTGTTTVPPDASQVLTVTPPTLTFPAIGTKQYSNIDFNPGATSSITNIPVTYTSNNPAVATVNTTLILGTVIGGSGYVNGSYANVPLTGGTGSGAQATIVVSGGSVISATITATGKLYTPGDILSCQALSIGGVGNGFNVNVASFYSLVHYVTPVPAAPNNTATITASLGGGATGTVSLPPDVSQVLTVVGPAITFPALGTKVYTNIDVNPNATSTVTNVPITYSSSNTAVATIVNGQIHFTSQTATGSTNITASQGGGATGTTMLPPDVTVALTVSAPTYAFPAIGTKVFTTVDYDPAATSTVPGLITYTSSDATGTIATIVNNKVHYVGLSTTPVTITATQNGVVIGTGTLTAITAPVITFAATVSKSFSSTDLAPGATSTLPSVPITYTSDNTAVATIVNGNIHFIAVGTAHITASQSAAATTAGLPAPADVVQTLTVTAPVITFTALGTKAFQAVDIAPVASSTVINVPITYSSDNTAVATIVNGNIHFIAVGTAHITASQGGGATGTANLPADVQQTLTVIAPTLTFAALGSKPYNSTDLAIPVAISSLGLLAPITYTSSDPTVAAVVYTNGIAYIHYVGIGTCTITASQAAYQGIAAPANVSQTLTVTPATIAFTALGSKQLNNADLTPAITPTIAITIAPIVLTTSDPTVATIIAGNVHIVGMGSCVITASQVVVGNYAPAPVTSALTVTATSITTPVITFTALGTKVYTNNGDITPPVTSTLITPITYTSSNPLVATILNGLIHLSPPSIINGAIVYPNPNTTIITASQGGGPNGVPGSLPADVSQTLTVTPAVLTFPALGSQKFSTVDLNPGATTTYTLLAADNTVLPISYTSSNPAVATIVNGNIHFVGLGSTVITASQGNVIVPDVSQTMVVVPPGITFAATASKVYSTADALPGATSTLTTTPITYTSSNTAIVSIVNGNLHFNGVGVVTITASQAAAGNSTAPFSVSQVLTVTPPVITFAATASKPFSLTDTDPGATSTLTTVPITYTSSNPSLVSIVNNKLHFNGLTAPASTSPVIVITASQASPGGFVIASVLQTLSISPQAIILQNPLTKTYGDPDFSPAVSTIGYPVAYSSATLTTATAVNGGLLVHIVAPGTSVITASQAGDATNTNNVVAAAANVTTTLTVAPAPLIVTPKSITRIYGIENPIPYPVIYTGFKSATGTVPLDDSSKFTLQPVLVSAVSNANPTVNLLTTTGGFIPKTLPVGTYTLTYGNGASTLYTFSYGTGILTITAAPQTLIFDQTPITKQFGTADFDPLARSTGDPVSYTSSDNTIATIVNGKVHIVGVGVVTITASITPTSGNYTGSSSLPVQLTVVQGTQTITASTIPFLTKGTPNYTVNATASSGLPVQVTIADPSIATVVGQALKPLHIGTTYVTLKQPGNADYAAAPDVVLFLQVVDPSGAPVEVHLALSPNGDGINDFLLIEGVQDYPNNHVSIINRNGIKVFDTTNYDNKNNVFVGKSKSGDHLPAGTYFYLVDYSVGDQQNHITGYFVLRY